MRASRGGIRTQVSNGCSVAVLLTAHAVLLAVTIVAAVAGCRRQTAGEEIANRINHTPPLVSTGECHFDMSGGKDLTVFRTLGMLNEYLGRQVYEDGDVVDRLYVNEQGVADAFGRLLRQLATEQQLEMASSDESSGMRTFRSRALTERIDSCFAYEMTGGALYRGPGRVMLRMTSGSLPLTLFVRGGAVTLDPAGGESDNTLYRQRALAYISGAWLRFQRGSDFVFANGQKKSALVADLLHRLGAGHVTVESTIGLIPQANMVHFTPTPLITAWLNQRW